MYIYCTRLEQVLLLLYASVRQDQQVPCYHQNHLSLLHDLFSYVTCTTAALSCVAFQGNLHQSRLASLSLANWCKASAAIKCPVDCIDLQSSDDWSISALVSLGEVRRIVVGGFARVDDTL